MGHGNRELAGSISTPERRPCLRVAAAALGLLVAGCTSVRVTETPRSRLEQQLFVCALERAVAQLDVAGLAGKPTVVELVALAQANEQDDGKFVRKFLEAWLRQEGIVVVQDPKEAELRFEVFANVLAVDHTEFLIGTPAFSVLGVPIPSISFYHLRSTQGHVELQPYVIDEKRGGLAAEPPGHTARSEFNEHTAVILIGWTTTDLDEEVNDKEP